MLDPPYPGRERYCVKCDPNPRKVYMGFTLRDGYWLVEFLEGDARTKLRRKLRFGDPAKILELAERGGADRTSADRESLKYGIGVGQGGVWLSLSAEQYSKLR